MTVTLKKRDLWMLINSVMLVALLGLVLWQQPWESSSDSVRTITVQGEGVVKAEADEFTFSPMYDFEGATSEEVIDAVAAKAEEITNGLKELGLEDEDIRIDASSYDNWYMEDDLVRSNLYATIVVNSKDKAQEVQDYLLTTSPGGSITPQPSFSREKQKELADEARTKAIASARDSADKSASELGLEVKEVVSVSESGDRDYGVFPMTMDVAVSSDELSLPVQTGEQEFSLIVEVVFEVE